jgi:predicted ABC-type ATPase
VTGNSNEIFIIHGESGCGKTSVIAKFADEVNNNLQIINLSFISIIILY